MKSLISGSLAVLIATVGGLTATVVPSAAEVRGDLRMVGEKPVSGAYDLTYANYNEKMKFCTTSRPAASRDAKAQLDYYCEFLGYRVARGKMRVKLHTYRVVEDVRGYDYYVLDVDVTNANRSGTSKRGWAKVHITNVGAVRLVDYADTTSISAREADCKTLGLSIGHSVGPASASMDWGTVRFCDKQAEYVVDRREGKATVYLASHTRQISSVSSQRIVKVRRGKRPTFKVSVHVPTDRCRASKRGKCVKYTNDTRLVSWRIGTTG